MNAARRKRLAEAVDMIATAKEIIQECLDEETESFENLPESLQGSERGEQMESYIGDMENSVDDLDSISGVIAEIAEV